jgi:hypothetical protein
MLNSGILPQLMVTRRQPRSPIDRKMKSAHTLSHSQGQTSAEGEKTTDGYESGDAVFRLFLFCQNGKIILNFLRE